MESAFLWAVKDTLGDRYTISVENVYTTTIRFIITHLDESFSNHRQAQLNGCKTDKKCPKTTETTAAEVNKTEEEDLSDKQIGASNVSIDKVEDDATVVCAHSNDVKQTGIKYIAGEPDTGEQQTTTGEDTVTC